MLNLIAQTFLLCITSAIIFFVMGSISFLYYVEKYHPPAGKIRRFLENLRFPADQIISFLPTGRIDTAAIKLEQNPPDYTSGLRIISAIVLLVQIIFYVWLLLRQDSFAGQLSISIVLVYMVVATFFTWRFGHKLDNIK